MPDPSPPSPPDPLESPPYTLWHPMIVALLERFLPLGYKLFPEFLLSRLSQRVDILVVRQEATPPGPVEKIHSILDYLGAHTLIEYKGPTDDLAGDDMLTLLGYAYQYMRVSKLKQPADVCLMVVADRITRSFLDQAKRCGVDLTETETESGIWRGKGCGFVMHGVETGKASGQGPSEHLLYTFSRAFLADPTRNRPVDEEERRVYHWLYQQVQQFKQARGPMAVKDVATFEEGWMQMLDSISAEHPEFVARTLAHASPAKRLEGLGVDDVLEGLSPDLLEALKRRLH